MVKNGLKNIVVLKNMPSNLVEEAIVILKNREIAKKFEYIDRKYKAKKDNAKDTKDYIVKEAESVLESYINEIENKGKQKLNLKFNIKYKSLKIYSIVISILFGVMTLIKMWQKCNNNRFLAYTLKRKPRKRC